MTSTQIEVRDGRTQITIPGEVVASGWLPPSKPLAWDEWESAFNLGQRLLGALAWVLGDLLVYGEREYGEDYAQVVGSLSAARINEVMRVARAYAHEERFADLSFEHHREVAHFPRPERAALLRAAVEGEQSRDVLRHDAHPVADRLGLARRGPGTVGHIDPAVETQDIEADVLAATRGESDGRIAEIEVRLKAVTPGPWESRAKLYGRAVYAGDDEVCECSGYTQSPAQALANADMIEHAPDDIAYLLRVLKGTQ